MHKKRPARLSLLRPVEIEDDVWAALNAAKPARCGAEALTCATQAGDEALVRLLLKGGVQPTQPAQDAPRGAAPL